MITRAVTRALAAAGLVVATFVAPPAGLAQSTDASKGRMEIYGFAMLDMGYESGQSDPDWFDVMRPTKLPSFENEFGADGHTYAGVRQSRLGVRGFMPTPKGEIKTTFEFELFGVGVDAGQTTFRLRHAYGEFGHWAAGQTWSPFMDPDVFPNSLEYWGPNGMVFFRNVQVRWMPVMGKNEVFVALERPGASGDPGILVGTPELTGLVGRFPYPDLSGHYKMNRKWGHLQIAGILRAMRWDQTDPTLANNSGSATGWGVNVSSNIKFSKDTLRLQAVYGEGIANYMNDATADVGAVLDPAEVGEALPVLGLVAFYDKTWSDRWTSSFGYSSVDIDNSDAQANEAFHRGQYALANLLYHPVPGLMWGGELQWGDRTNNNDGGLDLAGNTVESSDDLRLQFSVKYNFSHTLGGKP